MSRCVYLEGVNIKPSTAAEARALIGKRVCFLRSQDIDKTGRGIFFPRYGVVAGVAGREIAIDHPSDFVIHMSSLVEMIEMIEAPA